MRKSRKNRKPVKNKVAGYESSDNDAENRNVDFNALSVSNPIDILSMLQQFLI